MTEIDSLVFVDGRDALAYVIVRPDPTGDLHVDARAVGLSKAQAAHVLRQIAQRWEDEAARDAP